MIKRLIYFKTCNWSYSTDVVSYSHLDCIWKYKTYSDPVYITMIKMIFFKIYTWSYSAGVVSYRYLHGTWKYKTYRDPVYITMIKNDLFQNLYLVL